MEEEKYLSELIHIDELQENKLNLIEAPCGSGKSTFVTEVLRYQPRKNNILFLIDTRRGKEQFKAQGEEYEYNGEYYHRVDEVTTTTYAGFAFMVNKNILEETWTDNAIIVCDELQNCIRYSKFPTENTLQADGKNLHEMALSLIHERIKGEHNKVIATSATPRLIEREFAKDIFRVPLHGTPVSYKNKKTINYSNLDLLVQQLPSDKRGIIYVSRITQIQRIAAALNKRGINAVGIWSANNKDHPMTGEQIAVSNSIINTECVPHDVQVLLINASSETSINIKSRTDYIVVHSSDKDTQIQARGRYRADIDLLYIYDSAAVTIELPDYMLNRRLYKEDVQEFIRTNNLRDKKRELLSVQNFYLHALNSGYRFDKGKIKGGKRYYVLTD